MFSALRRGKPVILDYISQRPKMVPGILTTPSFVFGVRRKSENTLTESAFLRTIEPFLTVFDQSEIDTEELRVLHSKSLKWFLFRKFYSTKFA